MTATLSQLHAYIADHGFQSYTRDGAIWILIPWTRRLDDGSIEEGQELLRCHPSFSAVRAALGY